MGHQTTGTVKKERIDKTPLESHVALKKKRKAHSIIELMAKAILSADGMITVLSLLSHLVLVSIPCLVNCYSQKLKKKIQVQLSNMIEVYNHFMGGVDRADENTDKYRASIRGKKWYSSPLLFCFKLVLQNAWQLHKTYDEKPMDFLEFRRRVLCHYLETHGHPPEPGRRGRPQKR